jgi:Fuc2NAc and GlcNAc transferase
MDGAIGLVMAYIPLIILAVKFHAGALESSVSPSTS